ncbi:FG-GAP-like repeat-containing protein [Planctobacterium marinum]|uniref:Cadherin domain-containing protein n=1 Tax=Planctobacterium marinum TaxID=1631968 RepID=A0AA48KT94_9ALTE|nr:hypothetical protein MACH26_28150 [Planctobacterium marinum]
MFKNIRLILALSLMLGFDVNATNFDYDGDQRADFAEREAASFTNHVISTNDGTYTSVIFGRNTGDLPVVGDFDGDGVTDVAVRRASNQTWYIKNSSGQDLLTNNPDGISRFKFGNQSSDIPVPADYDGDGITDVAVRRPSTQYWYIQNSSGIDSLTSHDDGITRLRFGAREEDIPVPADYDGDGKADIAVRRPSNHTWYIKNSSDTNYNSSRGDGIQRVSFGKRSEDIPVPADYDGDGKADIAVRRPSNQMWYIKNSSGSDYNSSRGDGIQRINFGKRSSDIPTPADYDGDGIADIAVKRRSNGVWYVLNSSNIDTTTGHADGITRLRFQSSSDAIAINQPVAQLWYSGDIDADGLSYMQEIEAGTEIDNADTDNDGVSDGDEVANGTDPNHDERMDNQAPTIIPGSFTVYEQTVSEWELRAFDADGDDDNLVFTITEESEALDVAISDNKIVITTFAIEQPVEIDFVISVSDGIETSEATFTVNILKLPTSNNPPVLDFIESFAMFEENSSLRTLSANDADGDQLTFYVTEDSDVLDASINNDQLRVEAFNIDLDTYVDVTVTVSDGFATDQQTFSVTIIALAENTPPTITMSPSSLNLEVGQSRNVLVTIEDDKDTQFNGELAVSDCNCNNPIIEAYKRDSGFEVFGKNEGEATVTYTVTDSDGLTATATLNVTVGTIDTENQSPDFTIDGEIEDNAVTIYHNRESVLNILIEDPDSEAHSFYMSRIEANIGTVDLIESFSADSNNKTLTFVTKALPQNMDRMTYEMELNVQDDSGNVTTKIYELVVAKSDNAAPVFTFSDKVGAFVQVNQNDTTTISYQIQDDNIENVEVTGIQYWYGDETKFDVVLDVENQQFTVTTTDVEVGDAYGFVIQYVDESLTGNVNVELYVKSDFTEADQEMRELKNQMIYADQALKEYVYIGVFYAQVLENSGYITEQQVQDLTERLDVDDSEGNVYGTFQLYINNIEFYISSGEFHDEGFKSAYTTVINGLLEDSTSLGQLRYAIVNEMADMSEGLLPTITFETELTEYDPQNNYFSRFVGKTGYGEMVDDVWMFDGQFEFMNAILKSMNENAEARIAESTTNEGQ